MKLPTRPVASSSLATFLGLLSEPALAVDRAGRVCCVNDAARRLLGCDTGWPLDRLATAIGGDALRALRMLAGADRSARAGGSLPDARLPDGRQASLATLRIDAHCIAVVLRPFAGGDRPVDEPPASSPALPAAEVGLAMRRKAERSARDLSGWFDLSPAGLALFDSNGRLLRFNRAFEALVGETPASLAAATPEVQRLLCWHDPAALAALRAGAEPLHSQVWLPQHDGPARRLRAVVRACAPRARPPRFLAVVEDGSIEEERDLAQVQLGALIDAAGVGLATFQEATGWVEPATAPAAAALHFGDVDADAQGDSLTALARLRIGRDMVVPETRPAYDEVQQALRDGRRAQARYAVRHSELGLRWLLTRVEPATLASGMRATSVVTLDITGQETAQRRNEELLHELSTILESTSAGIAYIRGNVLVRCNRRFEQMLGLASGQGAGRSVAELFDDQPRLQGIANEALRVLAASLSYETEVEGDPPIDRDGPPRWYSLSARRVGAAAQARRATSVEAIVVLSDVTRIKSQQRELELLARDRELMFSLSEVGIAFLRQDRIERANQALAALAGRSAEDLARLPHGVLFADGLASGDEPALLRDGRWSGERRLRRRDGTLVWVQVSERLVVDGDPAAGVIATCVDVDARHRAEDAVALQAERTRAVLDSVLVGIVTVGPQGIEWMNRSARRMFGGDLADFMGEPISTVATPEPDHPFRRTRYLDELVEGQAETFECRVKARDGREFWVVGNAVATGRVPAGRQLTYALLDIERRRQAEARMAESQDSLQRLIEMAPLAIVLLDARTLRILQINQTAASAAGRPAASLVGCSPQDLQAPELSAVVHDDMLAAIAADSVTRREYTLPAADGRSQVWDARYLPLGPAGRTAEQLLLVATDVTEQRAAQEARYAAAVAQREMLIQEVHHRIKNNLQGVAGLLQQIGERKPEVAPAIGEAVGQLHAIAQVYGLQVDAVGPIALDGMVEAVTRSVQRLFGRTITLDVEQPDGARWLLPEAESIPIALTLNELLTNAIKHSAPPSPSSSEAATAGVSCRLVADADGVRLTVGNDGRLPEGFSLARFPGGLSGLGLVRALLPRRSARLEFDQQQGRVRVSLSLTPPGIVRAADG